MQFDAAGDEYLSGPTMAGLTACESFLVLQLASDPTAAAKDGLWRCGTAGSVTNYPWSGDGNVYDEFMTDTRKSTGNPAPNLASPHLYHVISTSSEWTSTFNGAAHYTTGTNTVAGNATPTLGSETPVGGSPMDGVIAEWIIYSGKLSDAHRANVKAYIAKRYGITVT